jgi:hypothetical protein
MALSEADKARLRYHLGYMTVVVASSFAFGLPQLTDTQFMVEDAMTRIQATSESRVISLLDTLDKIECQLQRASGELFARAIDGLEPNLDQPDMLEKEYVRWASRLADMLGVMPYPYSKRFRQMAGGGRMVSNVRVVR